MPTDVPELLRALAEREPTRPRLTWYGLDGERIELSGKVLDNWVAKTANLLVDELDVGPGDRVLIDLPPHWRSVVWLLACWNVGACAVPVARGEESGAPGAPVAVYVTDRPQQPAALAAQAAGAELVAVALPALATSFGPQLPPGAIDAATETRLQGDVFIPAARPAPGDVALELAELVSYAHLFRRAGEAADLPDGVRLLTSAGPLDCLPAILAPLILDGSVVLHADLSTLDPMQLAHLAQVERVTSTT